MSSRLAGRPGDPETKPGEPTSERILEALIRHLSEDVDRKRLRLMDSVLACRTDHLTVVLEDVYQPHNAASVIRSCDFFGISDLYAICNRNSLTISEEIAKGATDWVRLHRFESPGEDNTRACLESLKRRGYRIVATTLREGAVPIEDLAVDSKLALCFGTEEKGLSETAHGLADIGTYIPMVGFTQSLNVSVSVAVAISQLAERLHRMHPQTYLAPEDELKLKLHWLMMEAPNSRQRVKEYLTKNDPGETWKLPLP